MHQIAPFLSFFRGRGHADPLAHVMIFIKTLMNADQILFLLVENEV